MLPLGVGVIITNASDLAKQPVPEMLHYSTAKAAVVHLTQGLAPYLGQFGIRLLAQMELNGRGMAIPRLDEPEEIASLMLYLASPLAAPITRTVVEINCGSHTGY